MIPFPWIHGWMAQIKSSNVDFSQQLPFWNIRPRLCLSIKNQQKLNLREQEEFACLNLGK